MKCEVLRGYQCADSAQKEIILAVLEVIESHRLFDHQFFAQYGTGTLSRSGEDAWLKQRHFLSLCFPGLYANIISRSVDLEMLAPFVRQLYEEFGNGDPIKVHYTQLLETLNAGGISSADVDRTVLGKGTQGLIAAYTKWTCLEDAIVSAALFGLVVEPVIAMDMELSLVGLRKSGRFKEQDLTYFIDHSQHDYAHSWEILHVTLPKLSGNPRLTRILMGAQELLDSRASFYDQFV